MKQLARFLAPYKKECILGPICKPVSYTHLDVYKRQSGRSAPPADTKGKRPRVPGTQAVSGCGQCCYCPAERRPAATEKRKRRRNIKKHPAMAAGCFLWCYLSGNSRCSVSRTAPPRSRVGCAERSCFFVKASVRPHSDIIGENAGRSLHTVVTMCTHPDRFFTSCTRGVAAPFLWPKTVVGRLPVQRQTSFIQAPDIALSLIHIWAV